MTDGHGTIATLLYKQRTTSMMPQKEKVWLLQATWLCPMASIRSYKTPEGIWSLLHARPQVGQSPCPWWKHKCPQSCYALSISCQLSGTPGDWMEAQRQPRGLDGGSGTAQGTQWRLLPPHPVSSMPGGTLPRPTPEHEFHRHLIGDLPGTNKELLMISRVPSVEKVLEQEERYKYGTSFGARTLLPNLQSQYSHCGEQLTLDM